VPPWPLIGSSYSFGTPIGCESGKGGKGGKVKSRRQAIAIALKEAGASKYESDSENKKNLAKTKRKEARGETYQQK